MVDKVFRRTVSHKVVALSAWISRGIGAAVQLLTMRLILGELGVEQYALFALISGLTIWFGLADLGLGYALQNLIARARALGQPYEGEMRMAIYAGFGSFALLTLLLLTLREPLAEYYLAELSSFTGEQKLLYVLIAISLGVGGGVGNILLRAWYGEDRGWLSNLVIAGMWLVSYAAMLITMRSSANDKLLWCVLAYFAPQSLVALVLMVTRAGAGKVKAPDHKLSRELWRSAVRFWGFALMSALVLNTDLLILARLVDEAQIAEYLVVTKLLGFTLTLYAAFLAAIWPLSTQLAALNRWHEAIGLVKRYILVGSVAIIAATALLCIFRSEMVQVITGAKATVLPSYAMILLLGGYFIMRIWTDSYAMLLQSVGDLGTFWKWVPLQAVVSVAAQYAFASRWGAEGIALGLIVSYLLTVVWVLPRRTSFVLAAMKSKAFIC